MFKYSNRYLLLKMEYSKMGNKEILVKTLKSKNMTSSELSKETGIQIEAVRLTLSRLIIYGEVMTITKKGREFVYSLVNDNGDGFTVNDNIEYLKLLMNLYKQNVSYLSKNKKILNYILENEDKFNEIEKIIGESQNE